jgi:RNA recognition motif-containing protein
MTSTSQGSYKSDSTRMVEWCIRCGQNLSSKPHTCVGTGGYSLPGLTAATRPGKKSLQDSSSEYGFSPPLNIDSNSLRNSGILSAVAAGIDTPNAADQYFADRLEDTKWDNYWSAPTSSSLSSLAHAHANYKSPVDHSPAPVAAPVANAGGSPPDRNVWNVFVLSEYQLFKPSSSAPVFDAAPGNLPVGGTGGSHGGPSMMSAASSMPNDNSWTQESNLTSSGIVNNSSGSLDASLSFPSKFSDCKDYVGTGIADLLSPASGTPNISKSQPTKMQSWSSNSTDGEDDMDMMPGVTTRKLFVGRVPKDATEESVLAFFSQFGTVETADVNADRGCCFITFVDSSSVDRILEGKNVKYLDLEGAEVCARRYVVIEKDKIFVRGLQTGTTKDDLFKYFKQFGRIVNITLHQNKSGAHPFAFVRFARHKSVNQIMARNDHVICGKMIHCLRAHRQDASTSDDASAPSAMISTSSGNTPHIQTQPAALSKHFGRVKITNDDDSS